ncbi:hypothetical protein BO443_160141 [Burkholderia orbicola]
MRSSRRRASGITCCRSIRRIARRLDVPGRRLRGEAGPVAGVFRRPMQGSMSAKIFANRLIQKENPASPVGFDVGFVIQPKPHPAAPEVRTFPTLRQT